MLYQIITDSDNNVVGVYVNCGTAGGITVPDIPDEVKANYRHYKYINSEFVFNTDYKELEQQEQDSEQTTAEKLKFLEDCIFEMAEIVYAD